MKHPTRACLLALVATAALVPLASCSDNGLHLVRVCGKITYKGQPIQKGTVFFMPDETKGTVGPPGMSGITPDGNYVLSTQESGDGVIVGTHKVGLTGFDPKPVGGAPVLSPADDPDYLDAKAAASAEVRARGFRRVARKKQDPNVFADRNGNKWRYIVPPKLSNPAQSGIVVEVQRARTIDFEIDESGNVRITP